MDNASAKKYVGGFFWMPTSNLGVVEARANCFTLSGQMNQNAEPLCGLNYKGYLKKRPIFPYWVLQKPKEPLPKISAFK